jgi:hypothetical protein
MMIVREIKRRKKLKKVVLFFLALILLVDYGFSFNMDNAKAASLLFDYSYFCEYVDSLNNQDTEPLQSPPKRLCWELEKQGDANKYLKVIVTGTSQYRLLKGKFYNTNGDLAPVAGTMTINADDTRRISLQGTYVDVDENLHILILDASVDSKTKNGTVYVRRDEGATNSYNLTRIPCKTLPEPPSPPE